VRADSKHVNFELLKSESQKLHILLVEDNIVNTRIATQFLSKMGHETVAALNGKEGIDKLSKESFDIVLMDVEMPEMDGFEATLRIRNGEAGTDNSNIPVIAMTAHALNDFKNDCLKAGMNDFISKPVNFSKLGIILNKYCSSSIDFKEKIEIEQPIPNNHVLNKKEALIRFDHIEEIFDMVCATFLEDTSAVLKKLDDAISNTDYKNINFHAHTLKGLCGNISANTSKEICVQLESIAKEGKQFDQLRPLYESLLQELDKVKEILSSSCTG
jgi:CheY-like chemotaxis protein